MAGDNLGVLAGKRMGKQPASVPTEPVIAPQRIPVADDNQQLVSGQWMRRRASQLSAFSTSDCPLIH